VTAINLGQKIIPRLNPVSWQKKGIAISRYPSSALSPSKAQMAARIQFAEAATRNYGKSGKIGKLPAVAALVGAELSGKTTGGIPRKDRAAATHSLAGPHISAMKTQLSRM